jgi:REP element-mobilizing transposase RayT
VRSLSQRSLVSFSNGPRASRGRLEPQRRALFKSMVFFSTLFTPLVTQPSHKKSERPALAFSPGLFGFSPRFARKGFLLPCSPTKRRSCLFVMIESILSAIRLLLINNDIAEIFVDLVWRCLYKLVMRMKQFEFGGSTKRKMTFGGANLKGNAREKRPFHKNMFTHLVMRSRLAVGERSMLRAGHKRIVEEIVRGAAKLFSVKIERYINVGNHLHILIKAPTRHAQANFLRTVSGRIVRLVMRTEKGNPGRFEKFWDAKPFTRLVSWGRAYEAVTHYLSLNSLEAIGFTKNAAREFLRTYSTA